MAVSCINKSSVRASMALIICRLLSCRHSINSDVDSGSIGLGANRAEPVLTRKRDKVLSRPNWSKPLAHQLPNAWPPVDIVRLADQMLTTAGTTGAYNPAQMLRHLGVLSDSRGSRIDRRFVIRLT
jgi:hypothetical protein